MRIVKGRSSRSPKCEEGDGPGGGPPLSVSEVGEEKVRQDPRSGTVRGNLKIGEISGCLPISRGYHKIADAVKAFNFDFKDKIVLDIGSSTGGFTQYALDHGAKKVIAIEKGTNQMMSPLRHDPRVELHEKTDIFGTKTTRTELRGAFATTGANDEASPSTVVGAEQTKRLRFVSRRRPTDDPIGSTGASKEATRNSVLVVAIPDIILADVSFISLTKVLVYAKANLATPHTEFLVMLKPQFEASPSQLNKGVVKNDKIRRDIIKHFELWLKNNGFIIINKHDNALKGKTGNTERFYLLKSTKRINSGDCGARQREN